MKWDTPTATASFQQIVDGPRPSRTYDVVFLTDSSGHSFGAFLPPHTYTSGSWSAASLSRPFDILYFELATVFLAVHTFGSSWRGLNVWAYCDNLGVGQAWESESASDARTHDLLRDLHMLVAQGGFTLTIMWIDTRSNFICDYLSRQRDHQRLVHAAPYDALTQRLSAPTAALERV